MELLPCLPDAVIVAYCIFLSLSPAFFGMSCPGRPIGNQHWTLEWKPVSLLYGTENWILGENYLDLLESFQAEIGPRILKI